MISTLIAFLIIATITFIAMMTEPDNRLKKKEKLMFLLVFLLAIAMVMFIRLFESKIEPTAMDVYQNKTTLQVTYRDGVPVDSVVVFKQTN